MAGRMFTVTVKEFRINAGGDLSAPRIIRQGFVLPQSQNPSNFPPDLEEQMGDSSIEEMVDELLCDLGLCSCTNEVEELAEVLEESFPSETD